MWFWTSLMCSHTRESAACIAWAYLLVHHKTFDRVKTSTGSFDYIFSPCNIYTYCTAVGTTVKPLYIHYEYRLIIRQYSFRELINKHHCSQVCQVDVKSAEHLNYSVGLKDKMEWTLIQANPYIFTISYAGGIKNRSVYQKYTMYYVRCCM